MTFKLTMMAACVEIEDSGILGLNGHTVGVTRPIKSAFEVLNLYPSLSNILILLIK